MQKILIQKTLLLAASLATGFLLYKIFGKKPGNGLLAGEHTGNNFGESGVGVKNGFVNSEHGHTPVEGIGE